MDRRRFLELTGLAAAGLFHAACASSVTPEPLLEDDASPTPPDAARDAMRVDARVDAPIARDVIPAAFVIREAFTVLLNDTSCSGHDHIIAVSPAEYVDDTPVHFLGGSHLLAFRPSELQQFERGERLPFATIGPGPGHGHCGVAWRTSVGPSEPTRVDVCHPQNTAVCLR